MSRIRSLLPLLLLFAGCKDEALAGAEKMSFQARPFVHEGTLVLGGEADFVVRVMLDPALLNSFKCSGLVLGLGNSTQSSWVLTAGHCVGAARVVDRNGQAAPIEKEVVHPKYMASGNVRNDLALLRISSPLKAWPLNRQGSPAANDLQLFGWGKSAPGESLQYATLRKSEAMTRQDKAVCDPVWTQKGQKVDVNEEFCAGSSSSACYGDSGGPVFNGARIAQDKLVPSQLVGVLSQADAACNAAGIYDIYTTLDLPWIQCVLDPNNHNPQNCTGRGAP